MAILKDNAQVLRVYEQSNTSLIVVLLGRRLGQFRVLIKGGRRWQRKGFEHGFDLLNRGEILVYPRKGEGLWIFKEWEERARPELGCSLLRLRAASYLSELAEMLTRERGGAGEAEGANSKLFDALLAASEALGSGATPGPVLFAFTLRALECEGLLPSLNRCTDCGQTLLKNLRRVYLSGQGVYCDDCLTQAMKAARAHLARQPGLPGRLPLEEMGLRGFWLSPPALAALLRLQKSARPFGLDLSSKRQLGRALVLLVHFALERDLRTLPAAAQMVRSM